MITIADETGLTEDGEKFLALKQELAKVKDQLDHANIVIHHVVYNTEDGQSLAYEYLEANDLLK